MKMSRARGLKEFALPQVQFPSPTTRRSNPLFHYGTVPPARQFGQKSPPDGTAKNLLLTLTPKRQSLTTNRHPYSCAVMLLAHAILDRLAEQAEVFHLEGTSYRETHHRPAPKVPPAWAEHV